MKVVVESHNPRWRDMFFKESWAIQNALGSNVVAIHHIGSTSIPAIYAKPVIDMLVEVTTLEEFDTRNGTMEAMGYQALGEYGISGRRYFRKHNEAGIRTHHVHTFAAGSPEVERHLVFRDFMCTHPEWANRYSDLKWKLAEEYPHNIEAYQDGQDFFYQGDGSPSRCLAS